MIRNAGRKDFSIEQLLARRRLRNTKLAVPRFKHASEVVGWLGAMQAQEYPGAKWSLAQRMRGASDASLEEEFDRGTILRTHVLRPTWHFVLPEDIRWMQSLTSPRVHAIMSSINRREGLDKKTLRRSCEILAKSLAGGRYLTRAELAIELERRRVHASGLRLANIVMYAELEAVICSGPRRGKKFTYMLLEERAPNAKTLQREEALATLCTRYFLSHGPATLQDFSWWSGLPVADAKTGVAAAKTALVHEELGGKSYWSGGDDKAKASSLKAFLMHPYDEYILSYKDRSHVGTRISQDQVLSVFQFILIDGQIVATWKPTVKAGTVTVSVNGLTRLSVDERRAIRKAAEKFGRFLGLATLYKFSR